MKGKIFNAQEVQAIIAGTKVNFREVIKRQPCAELVKGTIYWKSREGYSMFSFGKCPYQVGQKIFVKESFQLDANYDDYKIHAPIVEKCSPIWYQDACSTNYHMSCPGKVRAAYSMPEWASRLTLQIKSIGVERLGDISEEDCIKEGIPLSKEFGDRYYTPENNYAIPKIAFMRWWNSTHKKPEEKFEANPWVWRIGFKVVNN